LGVRPGIWTRPTLTTEKQAESWRLPPAGGRPKGELIALDPSIPEALAYMAESIAAIRGWGYELIKHDYSTFDLTGRWGFEMGPDLTDRGWHFQNRGKTTAEIILGLYRTIRQSAGDAMLIGCNTIGHLAAGLVEAQHILRGRCGLRSRDPRDPVEPDPAMARPGGPQRNGAVRLRGSGGGCGGA